MKASGLTLGQPKVLDYLKNHDGASQEGKSQRVVLLRQGLDFNFEPHGRERFD